MEIHIRKRALFLGIGRVAHLVGVSDKPCDIGVFCPGGSKTRAIGFERLADIVEMQQEFLADTSLEVPEQHLAVEHVPAFALRHTGTDARLGGDHALGGERLHRLAKHRSRDFQPLHQLGIARQDVTRLENSGHDIETELVNDLSMICPQLSKTDRRIEHSALQIPCPSVRLKM
ncbi:hypothetical protein D3C87_1537930 [compost metagenome]